MAEREFLVRDLNGAIFDDCTIKGARFHNCALGGATFDDVDLSGSRFANVSLKGVTIDNANIDGLKILGHDIAALIRAARAGEPPR